MSAEEIRGSMSISNVPMLDSPSNWVSVLKSSKAWIFDHDCDLARPNSAAGGAKWDRNQYKAVQQLLCRCCDAASVLGVKAL